jgi:hypothetical protein
MKFSLSKQTESRMWLDNTQMAEKSCSQERDAQRPLADVFISKQTTADQAKPQLACIILPATLSLVSRGNIGNEEVFRIFKFNIHDPCIAV